MKKKEGKSVRAAGRQETSASSSYSPQVGLSLYWQVIVGKMSWEVLGREDGGGERPQENEQQKQRNWIGKPVRLKMGDGPRGAKPMIAGGEKNMMGAQQAGRQTGGRTDRHRQELLLACPSDKKDLSFSSFLPQWCSLRDHISSGDSIAVLAFSQPLMSAAQLVILSSCRRPPRRTSGRCLVAGAEPPDTWPPPLAEARFVAGWLERVAIALHRLDE
nr:unnamed protein product [Digitaria exilis]